MRKVPVVLLCFLFIGVAPSDEDLTIFLTDGTAFSNVSFLRLQGDTLVATFEGDTIFLPLQEISEISSQSRVLGFPGCWFGLGVGAIAGAACAAATGPYEAPNGSELPPETAMGFGASFGGCIGIIAGCIVFPENEKRYVFSDKTLDAKKAMIHSILTRHGARG